jgi:hypothetical protein
MLGRAAPGLSPEDEDHWEVRHCATSAKDALPNTFCGELNRLARTRAFRKGTACSHLTTAIIGLPVRSRQQVPCGDDWPGRVLAPVEVNFDRAATTNHVAAARRRMIGMVRWHRAARRR